MSEAQLLHPGSRSNKQGTLKSECAPQTRPSGSVHGVSAVDGIRIISDLRAREDLGDRP